MLASKKIKNLTYLLSLLLLVFFISPIKITRAGDVQAIEIVSPQNNTVSATLDSYKFSLTYKVLPVSGQPAIDAIVFTAKIDDKLHQIRPGSPAATPTDALYVVNKTKDANTIGKTFTVNWEDFNPAPSPDAGIYSWSLSDYYTKKVYGNGSFVFKKHEIPTDAGWYYILKYKHTNSPAYFFVVSGPDYSKSEKSCNDDKISVLAKDKEAIAESPLGDCQNYPDGRPETPEDTSPEASTDTTYTLLQPLGDFSKIDTLPNEATNPCPFGNYFNIMFKIFLGVCAVLAMIMIVWGGVQYMTSDLATSKEEGKKYMTNAILGLLLALGAFAILNTLNPDLLTICLNNMKPVTITIDETGQEYRLSQTQKTDTKFKRTSYYAKIKTISAQHNIPPCLLQVAIQRESGGVEKLVGHDENVANAGIRSRRDFISSGLKYNKSTFAPGTKTDPRITQSSFKNDKDWGNTIFSASNPTASDLGIDWRFSHSIGLFGVTFGPNNLPPAGAKELLNNPDKDIQRAADIMTNFYNQCNKNIENTWRAYGSGSCNGGQGKPASSFINIEAPLRTGLYNQCVTQDN